MPKERRGGDAAPVYIHIYMLKLDEQCQVFTQDFLLDLEVRLWCEDIEHDKRLDIG